METIINITGKLIINSYEPLDAITLEAIIKEIDYSFVYKGDKAKIVDGYITGYN